MAGELIACTSQLRLASFNTQRLEQLCTSIARELFQITTKSRGARVIRQISDRQARGNYAKPRIEGSEFAQKRLEGRLTQPSFLWTRRMHRSQTGTDLCRDFQRQLYLKAARAFDEVLKRFSLQELHRIEVTAPGSTQM